MATGDLPQTADPLGQPLGKHSLVGKQLLPTPATSIPSSKSLRSFKVRTSMHFCSLFSNRPAAKFLGCKQPMVTPWVHDLAATLLCRQPSMNC